jgi:aryl-alcohol dehydrogenase-like predicted oxidoreductase
MIDAAIDAGVTFFDTAEVYGSEVGGSETMLGVALRGKRERVVLASKFGGKFGSRHADRTNAPGSRRNVRRAIDGTLLRLQTDYVDLYYLHFPDPLTPIDETLSALNDLVCEGKVRYIGTSNLDAWQIADADWTARSRGLSRFVASQTHYNLIERTAGREVIPACLHYEIGFVPYYPLAGGLLTGKYRPDVSPPPDTRFGRRDRTPSRALLQRVEALRTYARERDLSLLQVAIGGLAAQPAVVSVIAGATSVGQLTANVAAANWVPSVGDLAALNALDERL